MPKATDELPESLNTIAESPAATSPTPANSRAWKSQYDSLQSSLPSALQSRLPSSRQVDQTLSTISSTSTEQFERAKSASMVTLGRIEEKIDEVKRSGLGKTKEMWETSRFLDKAYSVTNQSQITLNVSLDQVSTPLLL
jgi:hypothetical protein